MTNHLQLLSAILLVSAVLSILYSVLDPDKAQKLNTWFYILAGKRSSYDFEATIKRTRIVCYYFIGISALGIVLALINQGSGELFVWVSFVSLVASLYFSYPIKIKKSVGAKEKTWK